MYVAYVIYNLDDGGDLTMIGYSKTVDGAINILKKHATMEEDTFEYDWEGREGMESQIVHDDTREYGYQFVNGGLDG